MTKPPLISIAMPAYNAHKYIRATIDSLLNQTEKNFELIVINDGSTDDTEEIIKSYSDKRIRYYINDENLGIAKTYNRIIKIAAGKYLAITETDDISHPERLEIQSMFLSNYSNVAAVSTPRINFKNNPPEFSKIPSIDRMTILHTPEIVRSYELFSWEHFLHAPTMYRTDVFAKHNIYYNPIFRVSSDYDVLLRLCLCADLVVLKPQLLAYRQHNDSNSSRMLPIGKRNLATIRAKYLGDMLNDVGNPDNVESLRLLIAAVENFIADKENNPDFDPNILTIAASLFLYKRLRILERNGGDYRQIYRIYRQTKLLKNIRLLRRMRLNAKALVKWF